MDTILIPHPQTNRELLAQSVSLYKASFAKIYIFAILLSITVFSPRILSIIVGYNIFTNVALFNITRLWLFVLNLIGILFFIAILWHMRCTYLSVREPLIEDFYIGLRKTFYAFLAVIVQCAIMFAFAAMIYAINMTLNIGKMLFTSDLVTLIAIGVLFTVQFVLILYVSNLFYFTIPLIAVENKSILGAIEKSVSLVWNHWWRTFTLQVTPWFCYFIFLLLFRYFLGNPTYTENWLYLLCDTFIYLVVFGLFIPWVAAILYVQLQDLELRKTQT